MAENDLGVVASDIAISDIQKFSHEDDVGGLQNAFKVSSEVDITLAYASEKLVNLENLLLHVSAGENKVGAIELEDDMVSAELLEKCLTIDLLYAMLNFELRELNSLLGDVQGLIVDSLQKISLYEQPKELLNLVTKFHDLEELLKQSQERILEMKIQLTKLQMTSFSFKQNEWKHDLITSVNELPLAGTEWKPQIQTVEQKRVLRMLEKYLVRELELEKKLAELKQNEQDHKVKIRLVEQVSACMEEAAEVAWARFLEADNRAEVLIGISRDLLGKLQIYHFNHSVSANIEEEIKSKLQDCIIQLNKKETLIQKLESNICQLMTDNEEVRSLREKVQSLEEKLNETKSRLKEAGASSETSQQQVKEMEVEMESLKENMYAAEGRAGIAEEKVTQLTDSNLELTEELEFLKGSNDSNTKRVSLLEKQLRELDIQLQHARASSEASQEQQTMLYSAIWDMETLIDELKQKVATGEIKTESIEERCIMLSETNSEVNKELNFVRSRLKFMEKSLDQAALEKKSCAKDINVRAGVIMDTVMQLAMERERVQKQLIHLTKANMFLREKTKTEQRCASTVLQDDNRDGKEFLPSGLRSGEAESAKTSPIMETEITSESFQVEESPNYASPDDTEKEPSSSANNSAKVVMQPEVDSFVETGNFRKAYTDSSCYLGVSFSSTFV